MELPKIDTTNLLDKTYTILKEQIVHRKFKPNEKLSIPELADQLGVSRTPIRDALNRLEMDGLVKTVAKVGTFVNAIEIEDLLDIIDTRLMLELWVVEKLSAKPATEIAGLLRPLEALLEHSAQIVEQIPVGEYLKENFNLQFHIAFLRLGGNKRNEEIYRSMMHYHHLAVEQSLFTKEMVTSAIVQHQSVVAALRAGDFEAARAFIREHLDDSRERLIRRLNECGGQI
jgi:DNA-binding GntR family transcriptional regulator